jgi:hypothetical protein
MAIFIASRTAFEIVERLAHAHQHDVRDQPLLDRRATPVAEIVAGDEDLADNLGRGQVAHQPLGAGVAEGTGERAADLGGDAERAAILLGDVDGLDLVAAGDAQQVLAGAVGRDLPGDELWPLDGEMRGEERAVVAGEIAHRCEVGDAAAVDPLPDLARAHGHLVFGRAGGDQRRRELGPRHADEVRQPALWQTARQGQEILRDRGGGRSSAPATAAQPAGCG